MHKISKCLSALFVFCHLLGFSSFAFDIDFPTSPDPELTPGLLCENSKIRRYPEKIKYCERDVSKQTKDEVIEVYDRELGFKVGEMNRGDFKIDHFIPLCAGGSNAKANLWPQHKSIFVLTDRIEAFVCEILAAGKITQAEVIHIIRRVKVMPESAPDELEELQRRFLFRNPK